MSKVGKFFEELTEFFEDNYRDIYAWVRFLWGATVSLLFTIGVMIDPVVLEADSLDGFVSRNIWVLHGIRVYLVGLAILFFTSLFTIDKWASESFFDDLLFTVLEMVICVVAIACTVIVSVALIELTIWAFL